jgi:Rrf2 family transcriptional regulator, nitric oxide-sensitive transcriptional repressor
LPVNVSVCAPVHSWCATKYGEIVASDARRYDSCELADAPDPDRTVPFASSPFMRLTQFTDNALRCLTFLALSDDELKTARDIATRMGMSADHLVKVIQRLTQLGYVETTRGWKGGVRLARPADTIVVGEVVRQTEQSFALVACFDADGDACPIAPACALAPALDEALQAFLAVLDRYTLADLTRERRRLRALIAD